MPTQDGNDLVDRSNASLPPRRLDSSLFFLGGGVGIGAWAASLPAISLDLGLDKGALGLVLLCFALGAIATMTTIGGLVPRFGTNRLSLVGCLGFGAALVMVPHAPNMGVLALVVAIGGASFGTLDVSMNTHAALLERASGRHLMSSFHAMFSVGNLVGAGACGQILLSGGDVATCLGVSGLAVAALAVSAWSVSEMQTPVLEPDGAATGESVSLGRWQKRHLLVLGALAFLAFFAEGAIMDWTAIYLVGTVGASESTGAFGFAVFAGMMAAGRMIGGYLTRVLGPVLLLRVGSLLSAGALAVILWLSNVPAIFAALLVCGFGVANLVPAMFAAAGQIGGQAAGTAMSRVATMGYTGLLIGPPFIGLLAQVTSLRISLGVVLIAFFVIAAGAGTLRPIRADNAFRAGEGAVAG